MKHRLLAYLHSCMYLLCFHRLDTNPHTYLKPETSAQDYIFIKKKKGKKMAFPLLLVIFGFFFFILS